MRTSDLRRRLHILDELGVYRVLMGDFSADPVQEDSLFMPPWRERLRDGRLGASYGTTLLSRWQLAWVAWHQCRAGGGLWDEETNEATRRAGSPRPQPVAEQPLALLEMDVFISRCGHEMPPRELEVASLRWRDRLKPPAIAKRLGMQRPQVDALLRITIQRWMRAIGARAAA